MATTSKLITMNKKTRNNKLVGICISALGFMFLLHCGDVTVSQLDPQQYPNSSGSGSPSTSLRFESDILPIFSSNTLSNKCVNCHYPGNPDSVVNLEEDASNNIEAQDIFDDLKADTSIINDFAVDSSKILFYPLGMPTPSNMHSHTAIYNSTFDIQYLTIKEWIEGGAPF